MPTGDYLTAVKAELRLRAAADGIGPLASLYLGGGTPSKLGADGVERLVDTILETPGVRLAERAEVTLEANPEDVNPGSAAAWVSAGVNRLSLGVQSFDARVLAWMHRTHSASAARSAVAAARDKGIANISLDLIFALPQELARDWASDLDQALALAPEHVSLYGLTVEPHTPLGRWAARGDVEEAPEERYAEEFLEAHRRLADAGFEHYEVSNFARPGRLSRHNSSYWSRVPYVGIGPSAHSFDGVSRRWNEREYEAWRARAESGDDPSAGEERLTAANSIAEEVYLGLRTSEGVAVDGRDGTAVAAWVDRGWAVRREGVLRLTAEGWLRLDAIATSLTAVRSR